MTKMILFFRAFSLIISFLICLGAEARPLLGNHDHGLKLKAEAGNYGRRPYITPTPPASSPPNKQEIVGRPHHLPPPPSPEHDPVIGQLTTSSPHEVPIILLRPTNSSSNEEVGGRHDHVPLPPSPNPADEQHQIIITISSSTTDHLNSTYNHGAQHLPLQASY